ncbi:Putative transmembrane protein [hydrothermal vent metagenome]|uniref:Transmembrane protein n=1 Tax=hydrothermal vent metagenome TaxID=652676 RepID=A0A3B1BI19_9ZZZZ
MEAIAYLGVAMGLAWVSGINLYATVAVIGILGSTGQMTLPPELSPLANDGVIAVAALMYAVEFFADKTPGVDMGWDAIHTFIRIPAGAILAAMAVAPVSEEAQMVAFLLGGAVATASHATKALSRVAINTSPEPFSNWTASIAEDFTVLGALWVMFNHPYIMLGLVLAFSLFALWLTPRLFLALKSIFEKLFAFLNPNKQAPPSLPKA